MQPMKINVTNHAAITKAIEDAEGKAKARCSSAEDVASLAKTAEAKLAALGLSKCDRPGAAASEYEAGLPNAYRYGTESTKIEIKRFPSGWFLVGVDRIRIWPGQSSHCAVYLTEPQIAAIADRMRRPIWL